MYEFNSYVFTPKVIAFKIMIEITINWNILDEFNLNNIFDIYSFNNGATGQNRTAGLFITNSMTRKKCLGKLRFLKIYDKKMPTFVLSTSG